METKYIYLKNNKKSYFLKDIKDANIQNYYWFNYRILKKLKLLNKFFWGSWKKKILDYDLFILGENDFNPRFTKYIKKHHSSARIIVFFWNCINIGYLPILKDKNVDEFWTFDKNDAKKYNMKYNTQFYTKNIKLPVKKIHNDVFFCGRAKDRKVFLNQVKQELEKRNMKYKMHIVKNKWSLISYKKYLQLVASTNAILDICSGKQIGLSLRCMESIYFEKKLITNNLDIIHYDFYNSNNIFIIGKDNWDHLKEFLNTEYEKIDLKIIEYYDYHNWLDRFQVK